MLLTLHIYHIEEVGTTAPVVTANGWYDNTATPERVLDGIKADNLRFTTKTSNAFLVIALGQSQIVKTVRVYTDEVCIKQNAFPEASILY